ncbi:methyltransferase [Acetobacteraceae bacterium H6797]|nr:methyltransferase [Acetobacteraceae bacterium H6797]
MKLVRRPSNTLGDLAVALRHAEIAAWNTKVLGSRIASDLYSAGLAGQLAPIPERPARVKLDSRLCTQADIESHWLRYWCGQLGLLPMYHRKVWEDCYAVQALWESGMLSRGKKGLGFAVGEEWLPAYFAARGCEVLATDLDADDDRAKVWIDTGQHGGTREKLFKEKLIDRKAFDARVRQMPVDMNKIPTELHGQFDFTWSVCSFEHCGSIGQGLDFVINSIDCLKPGGIAVHTTEFNLDPNGRTIEEGGTVLFQRKHIEALGERLAAKGHKLRPVNFDPGSRILDQFVDLPPYPDLGRTTPMTQPMTPHLRMSVAGHVSTSIGLIIEAKSAPAD